MQTNDILMVLGVLAIVLFLVSVGLSYKSWRAHTLILVFLVFCAGVTQFVMASYVLSTHQSWRDIIHGERKGDRNKREKGLIARIDTHVTENDILENGEWDGGILVTEGIDQVKMRIGSVVLDRGSLWKNCVPANKQDDGSADLRVPNPEGRQLRQDMLVYVFEQAPVVEGEETALPDAAPKDVQYLGEFRISQVTIDEESAADGEDNVTYTTITLKPSLPMGAFEATRVRDSKLNWTIYDRMPIDNHYIFSDVEDRSAWLPASSVAEYDKDMQAAEEGDPDANVEVLVRFQQDYVSNVPLLVRKPGQDPDDDPNEVAVEFEKNQLVWLPKKTVEVGDKKVLGAEDLAAEGIVDIRDKIRSNVDSGIKLPGYPAPQSDDDITQLDAAPRYVRSLRDYRSLFSRIRANQFRQKEEAAKVTLQSVQIDENRKDAEETRKALQETIARLESDAAAHTKEQEVLDGHVAQLEEQYKKLRATRDRLLKDNAKLAAELDRLEKQAARKINQRAPAPRPANPIPEVSQLPTPNIR